MSIIVYVFDADGTLTPHRASSLDSFSFEMLPGRKEKIKSLKQKRAWIAIASNQSSRRPHDEIAEQLCWTQRQVDADYVTWATEPERKKPSPSMLEEIADFFKVKPTQMLFVGDDDVDYGAAKAFGCAFSWANDFFSEE